MAFWSNLPLGNGMHEYFYHQDAVFFVANLAGLTAAPVER